VQVTVLAAIAQFHPAPAAELTEENCAGSSGSWTVTVPVVGRVAGVGTPSVKS